MRPEILCLYHGPVTTDHYGRTVPVHAHGSQQLESPTFLANHITHATMQLFHRIINTDLLVRRITLAAGNVVPESYGAASRGHVQAVQLDLFADAGTDVSQTKAQEEQEKLAKERRLMEASLAIRQRFGKNALLKGINFAESATTRTKQYHRGHHK